MIGAGLLQAANPVVEDLDVTESQMVNQERLARTSPVTPVLTLRCSQSGRSRGCRCSGGVGASGAGRWSRSALLRRTGTCVPGRARKLAESCSVVVVQPARSGAPGPCFRVGTATRTDESRNSDSRTGSEHTRRGRNGVQDGIVPVMNAETSRPYCLSPKSGQEKVGSR